MKPREHKTVLTRILAYAQEVGWTFVSCDEAEQRRGISRDQRPVVGSQKGSLFFDDALDAKVREFNPIYSDVEGALLGSFKHLHTDI